MAIAVDLYRRRYTSGNVTAVSHDQNKARALGLIAEVLNGHDPNALARYTSTPAVIEGSTGLLESLPDVRAEVKWAVAEDDMAVVFFEASGTQQGPMLMVEEPTGNHIRTSFMLAFKFDDDGQIVDVWLGSNFIEILAQLGWGFAPVGEPARPQGA